MPRAAFVAAALVALLVTSPSAGASDGSGITGTITRVDGRTVLVEEEPAERSGSDKSYVEVKRETEISVRRSGEEVRASFEDVSVGRRVEVVFEGAVAESYPTQARAGSVVILEDGSGALSDTGGGTPDPRLALFVVCLLGFGAWTAIRRRA